MLLNNLVVEYRILVIFIEDICGRRNESTRAEFQ